MMPTTTTTTTTTAGENHHGGNDGNGASSSASVTTYAPVIYKKSAEGSLTCSDTALVFRPYQHHDTDSTTTTTTTGNANGSQNQNSNWAGDIVRIEWNNVAKHQVSPLKYPKALLKIILVHNNNANSKSLTFQMAHREELERIRKDISNRLQQQQQQDGAASMNGHPGTTAVGSKKRPHSNLCSSNNHRSSVSFGRMDDTALAVTRAALLASNAALRQQHRHLVTETGTLSEIDFWHTHRHCVEEEHARMAGVARPGTGSLLQSHLPSHGRVTLGVAEMRQIFVLYPAVHRAYEDKVPLELSDEQFWRKYLESEYFHRDRGRVGMMAAAQQAARSKNEANANGATAGTTSNKDKKSINGKGPTFEQQEARAAAVGTDDLFSRYDQKIQEEQQMMSQHHDDSNATTTATSKRRRAWGRHLAVGQFDLASTLETERGHLLEGPRDYDPPYSGNSNNNSSRVIAKYNRHWQMVLHPDEAIAGSNLMEVARRSVRDVLPHDQDAAAHGGLDAEMRRLVTYAETAPQDANHAAGVGDDDLYEPLSLQHVEVYYKSRQEKKNRSSNNDSTASSSLSQPSAESVEDAAQKHASYARDMAARTQKLVQQLAQQQPDRNRLPESAFPPAETGSKLLTALTKKMAKDSATAALPQGGSLEQMVRQQLTDEFRDRLQAHFRRSSELLRHFFGLRRLAEKDPNDASTNQKSARIVGGMETLYREMDGVRRGLPQSETGEIMRKMYLPIMDQLDWAFKLHRDGSGGGGGGGFVTV